MLVLIYHIILCKHFDFGDINLFILADQITRIIHEGKNTTTPNEIFFKII